MAGPYWTSKEVKRLRRVYPNKPIAEVAQELNRTVPSIAMKASSLGLRRKPALWKEDKRWCGKCLQYRNPDDFCQSAQKHPTERRPCRECHAKWYQTNGKRLRANSRRYRAKSEAKARKRQYRAKHADKMEYYKRSHRYLTQYGLSVEQYAEMEQRQGGLCAICNQQESFRGRRLSIDHDHNNDCVRELLCQRCNLMIGAAFDNPEILERGAQYLRRHKLKITKIS